MADYDYVKIDTPEKGHLNNPAMLTGSQWWRGSTVDICHFRFLGLLRLTPGSPRLTPAHPGLLRLTSAFSVCSGSPRIIRNVAFCTAVYGVQYSPFLLITVYTLAQALCGLMQNCFDGIFISGEALYQTLWSNCQ